MNFRRAIRLWLHGPLGGPTLGQLRDPASWTSAPRGASMAELERAPALVEPQTAEAPSATIRVIARTPQLVQTGEPDSAFEIVRRERKILEEDLRAEVLRWLGPDFELQDLRIEEGSVVVSFRVVASAPTTIATVDFLLDALKDAAVDAVNAVLVGFGIPVGSVTGNWSPNQAVLGASATAAAASAEPGASQLGKWLVTAGAFAVATLTVLKVSDADLTRARLFHPHIMSITLGVIVFATLLGVLWPAWAERGTTTRAAMAGLTVAVLVVGVAVFELVWLSSETLSSVEKPQIEATAKEDGGARHLMATVTADGVIDKKSIFVEVFGIPGGPDAEEEGEGATCAGSARSATLYAAATGADRDGKAGIKLDVPIAAGSYKRIELVSRIQGNRELSLKCPADAHDIARASLPLAAVASRPRLSASWTGAKRPPVLSVKAKASGLTSEDRVLLSIRRQTARGTPGGRLYLATLGGDDSGLLDQAVDVPLPNSPRAVCVIAQKLAHDATDTGASGGPCDERRAGVAAVMVPRPPQ